MTYHELRPSRAMISGATIRDHSRDVRSATTIEFRALVAIKSDPDQISDAVEVRIARIQYHAGRRDRLWVSNLQTNQLAIEALVIRVRSLQRANRIQLHLALGGSMDATPAATISSAQPAQ